VSAVIVLSTYTLDAVIYPLALILLAVTLTNVLLFDINIDELITLDVTTNKLLFDEIILDDVIKLLVIVFTIILLPDKLPVTSPIIPAYA
jgi:hypothetical protein